MRKASILASTLVLILGSVLLSAFANAETYSSNPYKSLEGKIAAALSSGGSGPITVQDVKKTSAAGLLEVTLDSGLVLYATEQGDHFVVGDLYAIRKDGLVNLAEEKREQDRVALIDGVDLAQMIVFTPDGETRDYITVFTDVTCFYCQKLHKRLPTSMLWELKCAIWLTPGVDLIRRAHASYRLRGVPMTHRNL